MKLTTRDPLKRMLYDTPLEIIRRGADAGSQEVAEYVRDTALINAPWHSGDMANSHYVWKPRQIAKSRADKGVIAQRRVGVSARRDGGHYYPVAIEFGWHPGGGEEFSQGYPWLRPSLKQSESAGLGIYRKAMRSEIARGKGAIS